MPKNALVILHPDCEELELIAPLDVLRRGGVQVTLAHTGAAAQTTGKNGLTLLGECTLASVENKPFDAVILPGGPGIKQLRGDALIVRTLQAARKRGALIGCICAAPLLLLDADLIKGHRYTAHPTTAPELPDALADEPVVADQNLITARGAGTATRFGLALLAYLSGRAAADEVAEAICFAGDFPG